MMPQTFPHFDDGDVEIQLSADDKDVYVLHSWILALHSSFFKTGLSGRWTGNDGAENALVIGTSGKKVRWIYQLRFEKESSDGILIRKTGTLAGDSVLYRPQTDPAQTSDLASGRRSAIGAHLQLLRAFYHLHPSFSLESERAAGKEAEALANVADMYDSVQVVGVYIDLLFTSRPAVVKEYGYYEPQRLLDLSLKTKIDWLFREATVHLTGLDNTEFAISLADLNKGARASPLMQFLEDKRNRFRFELLRMEHMLLCLVPPPTLETENSTRAYSFFRHTVAERISTNGMGSGLVQGYAGLYRHIATGRLFPDYLTFQHGFTAYFRSFSKTNPTEAQIGGAWESLEQIQARAKAILEPILCQNSFLSLADIKEDEDHVVNLAFTEVADDEIPWKKQQS